MIQLDGDQLHIACSPVSRITVPAGSHRAFAASGDGLTEATIALEGRDFDFFRIELTDAAGRHAWSNIFWLDENS